MVISFVVPIYNESAGLIAFLSGLAQFCEKLEGFDCEWVLVDDGSSDGSWGLISQFRDNLNPSLPAIAIRLSRNFGKESAIFAGLQHARGDATIVMDSDLQHPLELIPRMLSLWSRGGVEIVEAVKGRRQPEAGWRRWAAVAYYWLFFLASGLDLSNSTDFKLLDRRVVDTYLALPERRRFFRGLTVWLGFRSEKLEFEPPERLAGGSGWGLGQLLALARQSIISFSALPLRLVTWLGIVGLLFSGLVSLQTLWYQWQGLAEEGFPTVILLVLGMGSMILLALGIIGEYVSEIYWEVKRRPAYVISDIVYSPPVGSRSGPVQP